MPRKSKVDLRKAIDVILQDLLKDGIKALLAFFFNTACMNFSAVIILALLSLFISAWYWLRSSVSIPIYIIFLAPLIIILIVLLFQFIPRILDSRQHKINYQALLWKLDNEKEILGPLCLKCEANMFISDDQFRNAAHAILGNEPEYIYKCECGYQVKRNIPPSEMARQVKKIYSNMKLLPTQSIESINEKEK